MEFRDYARLFRAYWVLILVFVLAGIGGGALLTTWQSPTYNATSKSFVAVRSGNSVLDLAQGGTYVQQIVSSYAQIATTPYVLQAVRSDLGITDSIDALQHAITASAPPDTAIIQVTASARSPRLAADLANATSNELVVAVDKLSSGERAVKVTQVQPAGVPTAPASPSLWLNVALGAIAGIVIAIAITALREALNTRVRGVRDVERISDEPVLGAIPASSGTRSESPVAVVSSRTGRVSEAYRLAGANLAHLSASAESNCWAVTSAIQGEGKTLTAIGIAFNQALVRDRVLLIEADFRAPRVAQAFRLPQGPGLFEVLSGRVDLLEAVRVQPESGLSVLTAGEIEGAVEHLLQTRRMQMLVDEARRDFDLVIIDAPALLETAEATAIARMSTSVVLVAAANRVRSGQLESALALLGQIGARTAGVLVTFVPARGAYAMPRRRNRSGGRGLETSRQPERLGRQKGDSPSTQAVNVVESFRRSTRADVNPAEER